MEKFKFSLAIIALIFLLPNSSGEVSITANGESKILFVDSGENVTFTAKGIENTTSILWDFGIDINGPNTRYSNLTEIKHTVHADGRYNITLTANYENENSVLKELILIVTYEEDFKQNIVHSDALFFAIAAFRANSSFWAAVKPHPSPAHPSQEFKNLLEPVYVQN